MNKLLGILTIAFVSLLVTKAQAQDYPTKCYQRQQNQLISQENCLVTDTVGQLNNSPLKLNKGDPLSILNTNVLKKVLSR